MLSCVVFDNSTSDAANSTSWFRDDTPPFAVRFNIDMRFMIVNTRDGNVVTSVLTIESVSLSDNGTGYFCVPTFSMSSYNGVISVAGEYEDFVYICKTKSLSMSSW